MLESQHQLDELLADPVFAKTIAMMTRVVMSRWCCGHDLARGIVMSAIGEPKVLACIHSAWIRGRQTGRELALVKVIVRRRVLDLLGKDARRLGHSSVTGNDLDTELTPGADSLVQRDPQVQLELVQVSRLVHRAMTCFASQGTSQRRQASLLKRYVLDEASYSELRIELGCSEIALRVRVHKAIGALRKHILWCHPELVELLGMPAPAHLT